MSGGGARPRSGDGANTTIVSADALAANVANWRLLDCRAAIGDVDAGRRAWEAGHIPGAQHADLDRHLAAPPGERGRHPLPDPEELRDAFQAWGVNDDDQVVAYDDAGGAFAARAWWLARWLGHAKVAVLDGGLGAWNGPLVSNPTTPEPGNFSIRESLVLVTHGGAIADALDAYTLIDARSRERFDAVEEPFDDIAGHIPGAHCVPFGDNLREDGRFRPSEELRERFEKLTDNPVCYCGSGVTAAHNVLAMRIAGYPEPALYPGSWSEWIRDPDRPRVP